MNNKFLINPKRMQNKMKLLLTSSGLRNKIVSDFFISILGKKPKECSVLIIAYVQNDEEQFYISESKKELLDLGIKNISFLNLKEDVFENQNDFDVIYVCGGNTFAILNRMRILSMDKFIINSINKSSVYFGISAGSIIAGPNIEIAGFGSEGDINEIGLKNLSGLNLTNISIFPHYRDDLKSEVDIFRSRADYPVVALKDGEAIFVEDSGYQIIK